MTTGPEATPPFPFRPEPHDPVLPLRPDVDDPTLHGDPFDFDSESIVPPRRIDPGDFDDFGTPHHAFEYDGNTGALQNALEFGGVDWRTALAAVRGSGLPDEEGAVDGPRGILYGEGYGSYGHPAGTGFANVRGNVPALARRLQPVDARGHRQVKRVTSGLWHRINSPETPGGLLAKRGTILALGLIAAGLLQAKYNIANLDLDMSRIQHAVETGNGMTGHSDQNPVINHHNGEVFHDTTVGSWEWGVNHWIQLAAGVGALAVTSMVGFKRTARMATGLVGGVVRGTGRAINWIGRDYPRRAIEWVTSLPSVTRDAAAEQIDRVAEEYSPDPTAGTVRLAAQIAFLGAGVTWAGDRNRRFHQVADLVPAKAAARFLHTLGDIHQRRFEGGEYGRRPSRRRRLGRVILTGVSTAIEGSGTLDWARDPKSRFKDLPRTVRTATREKIGQAIDDRRTRNA